MLCPHKQNPQACLTCYHARKAAPVPTKQATGAPAAVPQVPLPQPPPGQEFPPEAFGADKLWEPPKRPQLIDRLPRRPK